MLAAELAVVCGRVLWSICVVVAIGSSEVVGFDTYLRGAGRQ